MIKSGPSVIGSTAAAMRADKEMTEIAGKPAVPSVSSDALLGVRGELKIEHNGEQYSLRRTRQGKLILTK